MTAFYPATTRWPKPPVHHFPGRNTSRHNPDRSIQAIAQSLDRYGPD